MSRTLALSRDPVLAEVYDIDIPLSNEPTLPRRCGFSFPTEQSKNWVEKNNNKEIEINENRMDQQKCCKHFR